MSSRAHRVKLASPVQPFRWASGIGARLVVSERSSPPQAVSGEHRAEVAIRASDVDVESVERDAFARGYAEGERASTLSAMERVKELAHQLSMRLDDLVSVRTVMAQKTERQLVQLALAIARRIVGRELRTDRELLVAMARVAIDRIGSGASAVIKLHPSDYALIARQGTSEDGPVRIEADSAVAPGECSVHSEFGVMDASASAQFDELSRTLLGEADPPVIDVTPAEHGSAR